MAEGDLRLFIAVPIPADALEACRGLIDGVRAQLSPPGVRWVRLDGLHVTLRFLGPTPDEKVEAIGSAVRAVAAASSAFDVRLAGAGAFPTPERPRALWLGVDDGAAALGELAERLDADLVALGWPPE